MTECCSGNSRRLLRFSVPRAIKIYYKTERTLLTER